jgi:hypothetical protein
LTRATYRKCRSCGDIHSVSEWPRECLEQFRKKRSDLPMPAIRSDGMDPIVNHANGLLYDSRSAYERAVKDAGCVIVGNDIPDVASPSVPDERDMERDIKTAIEQVEAGYVG